LLGVNVFNDTLNTHIAEWSNSCLNQQLLREMEIIKLPKTVSKVLPKTVTTSSVNYALGKKGKEILNKKEGKK
jgi:hypothetical protein